MGSTIHRAEHRRLVSLLRELREATGMSMRTLGEQLGRSHSYIAKLEAGERRIDVVELQDLLEILDVDLVAFLTHWSSGATTIDGLVPGDEWPPMRPTDA